MLARLRQLLGNVRLYIAVQKAVGADRVRYRCLTEAEIRPGDRVLDVGCGPAYYVDRLPAVDYYGFDTSAAYIAYAQRRYGDRGRFRCEVLTRAHLAQLPQFDVVLLFGLLHHLPDRDCTSLLGIAARSLAAGGRVVSVDPCLHPGQGRISRWMSENDRGEHVRSPEAFAALARTHFAQVSTQILDRVSRVPSSHVMMRLVGPQHPPVRPDGAAN